MKTTLKRGYGRGASLNGNGHARQPPVLTPVTRYKQPEPPRRGALAVVRRILVGTLLLVVLLAGGLAGGAYLYYHQTVSAVSAHSKDVKKAAKQLDIPLANHAAIALIIGYDHRMGKESAGPSRSDTMMLVRADPVTDTISLLSFPRDLYVTLYCPDKATGDPVAQGHGRINGAYAICQSQGSLSTVKQLTGLPINYLITVDFHGFKQVVDTLGGVWMDVDRRYYNRNVGTSATNYANINLHPGYQKLNGDDALEFVRYRHTDSDLYRLARQQQFVKAFKQQVSSSLSPFDVPKLVTAITKNIEVGSTGANDLGKQILRYALFAYDLPNGHFFQVKLGNLGQDAYFNILASETSLQQALSEFQNPDVQASRTATAAALGRKLRTTAPKPKETNVYVLNGNGVPGAASTAAYGLSQHGYVIMQSNTPANAPSQSYFKTKVYYPKGNAKAKAAATPLANLFAPADVEPLPADIAPLAPAGTTDVVVVGTTFHGDVAPPAAQTAPVRQKPSVRYTTDVAPEVVERRARLPFPTMIPTVLEQSSRLSSMEGARMYYLDGRKHKSLRLTFVTGGDLYWGIEESDWADAPILARPSQTQKLKDGRTYDLYYNGSHLHMVVLRGPGTARYWVVNSLLDDLSNETMLAIAKGLKARVK